jgi:broad specificity phosphatase PhoE
MLSGGGESVNSVVTRMEGFVRGLEARHRGCHVILFSHGDTLSILGSLLIDHDVRRHREMGLPNCGFLAV